MRNLSQHGLDIRLLYHASKYMWDTRGMYPTFSTAGGSWMLRPSCQCFGKQQQFHRHVETALSKQQLYDKDWPL